MSCINTNIDEGDSLEVVSPQSRSASTAGVVLGSQSGSAAGTRGLKDGMADDFQFDVMSKVRGLFGDDNSRVKKVVKIELQQLSSGDAAKLVETLRRKYAVQPNTRPVAVGISLQLGTQVATVNHVVCGGTIDVSHMKCVHTRPTRWAWHSMSKTLNVKNIQCQKHF